MPFQEKVTFIFCYLGRLLLLLLLLMMMMMMMNQLKYSCFNNKCHHRTNYVHHHYQTWLAVRWRFHLTHVTALLNQRCGIHHGVVNPCHTGNNISGNTYECGLVLPRRFTTSRPESRVILTSVSVRPKSAFQYLASSLLPRPLEKRTAIYF